MDHRLLAVVPAVVLAASLYVVDLPVFVQSPGTAEDAVRLIDIDGTDTYEPQGRLLFTTVFAGSANLYYAVRAWMDPEARVLPESLFLAPGQTEREYDAVQRSLMDQSKLDAAAAALSEVAGYPRRHGPGAVVQFVLMGVPADGKLFPGDLVLTADGERVAGVRDVGRAIDEAGVGGRLVLEVEPIEGGERRTVTLVPALLEGEPRIGATFLPNFPFDVSIESGDVGGPSAGMMWAVAIVDLLTPGDLTGGRTIAGTGTIDFQGNVGPIGGITEKAVAAERAGADLFLVPEANFEEVRDAPVDLQLVSVATLDEALTELRS